MEKTVYLGITGDIIHPGIINIITEGAKYGCLTVGVLTDSAIVSHKRLPYLTYEQRKQVIENIKGVSKVVLQEEWSYVPNLKNYNRILLFTATTGRQDHSVKLEMKLSH